eukprot:s1199_g5.t1
MPVRPLKDKDRYYPGSPWGDKPPEEMQALAAPGTVTVIDGLRGPIVERQVQAGTAMYLPQDAMKHVDALQHAFHHRSGHCRTSAATARSQLALPDINPYRQLVGDSDGGRLLDEREYEALREKAADPERRLWVYWVEADSGLECKAIGPASTCFCGHRYREHTWADYPETRTGKNMRLNGSGDLKCSSCRQSFLDHDKRTRKCQRGKGTFTSSYSCSCNSSYDRHCTVVQTQQEREASGKATGTPWMQAAEAWTGTLKAGAGLPTAHMGGVGGFTSLADGIDRALAGLEPGFEPQRVYSSLEEAHNLSGVKPPALPPPRPPQRGASTASRAGEDIVAGRKRSSVWWNRQEGRLEDSEPKKLQLLMPVIYVTAVEIKVLKQNNPASGMYPPLNAQTLDSTTGHL